MSTSELSVADMRDAQKRHWTSVADAWAKWSDWTERNFAPLTAWLSESTGWSPGANLLDIGCGAGYPALPAAAAVRPHGSVTTIDVSPKMIDVASERAKATGLDNLEFHEMAAETLGFADGTFDGAMCACTLMFSPEPERVIREVRRVLKPGGRFAIVVWDEPSLNPFSMLITSVMSRFIVLPPLPAAPVPGPFRFAPAGELESALREAGFSSFSVDRRVMTFEFSSVETYLQVVGEVTGRARRMEALPADEMSQFRQALSEAVAPHVVDGRVRLDATVRFAVAQK